MIYAEIPLRTPTLNVWQRLHWARRKRIGEAIAWALLASGLKPERQPIKQCRIRIERESTKAPDVDGLYGGLKPLLDALQPRSKRHPYGLGIIADDGPTCVLHLEAAHIDGKGEKTRIWITPE